MTSSLPTPPPHTSSAKAPGRSTDRFIVAACLVVVTILAVRAILGDSITFDESAHLTAGMSYLKTGDFRLLPETPPLAEMWAALPVLLYHPVWLPPDTPGWADSDIVRLSRTWLFRLNDGEKLLPAARAMIVILLLTTCVCIYLIARRLFGRQAGLLALIVASFCPTLLAHGHLVTADVPAVLCFMLTLLTYSRLLERMTLGRLLGVTVAMAALCLIKLSWPFVLPALAVMAGIAVFRTEPLQCPPFCAPHGLIRRRHRAVAIAAATLFVSVGVWSAIWTCFGWRYSSFRPDREAGAMMAVLEDPDQPLPTTMAGAWEMMLHDREGRPRSGPVVALLRWTREHRLLPEAYLYGVAWTLKFSRWWNPKYLNGRVSTDGWFSYFPITFAVKTPVATMILLTAGIAAVLAGRTTRRADLPLLAGLVTFTVVYFLAAVVSRFNIGHRHLLPIYPAVLVFAGASAAWMRSLPGRCLIAAAVVWLVGANLRIHPHYLSYFNELIGGPANGHLYLADSNIDWGQDLKRLADYARRHPDETIKLAYFGTADPRRYGFRCETLPSFPPFGEPAALTAGTYVISVTQLLGVYQPLAREDLWATSWLGRYRALHQVLTRPVAADESAEVRCGREMAAREYEALRHGRLLSRLRFRRPDDRIGWSLVVFRLSQPEIDGLLAP